MSRLAPARRNAESKFAFVEFGSANDAQDAARGRDGIKFADNNIRVEISRPRPPRRDRMIVVATAGTASTVGGTTTVAVAETVSTAVGTTTVAGEVEVSTIAAVVAVTATGNRARSTPIRRASSWTTFCRAPAGGTWRTPLPRWHPCCRAPCG